MEKEEKEKTFSADSSQPLKMAVFPRPVLMKYLKTILFAVLVLMFSGCDEVENLRPFNSNSHFGYNNTSQTPTKNVQFMLDERNTVYIPAGMKIVAVTGSQDIPHVMVLEDMNGSQFILHRCNNHIFPIKEVEYKIPEGVDCSEWLGE